MNVNLGSFSRAAREPSVCLETSIVSAGDLDFSEDLSFWLYMYTFRPDYLMLRGKHTDKPAVTELLNKHRQAMVPLACNLLSLRGVSTYWKRISDRLSLEAWRVYGDPTLKIYRHLFPRPHDLPPLGVVDEFTQYAFMQDLPGCSDVSDHAYLALAAILSYHFSPAASMIVDFVAHEKAIGSKFQRILKSLGQRKKTVFKVPDTR